MAVKKKKKTRASGRGSEIPRSKRKIIKTMPTVFTLFPPKKKKTTLKDTKARLKNKKKKKK